MAIAARTAERRRGRLADRAQAGELLRPLLRGATGPDPVVVGVGMGGLAVAVAARARDGGSHLGALGVEEFDLPDALHPGASCGAVSSTGRVLLRSPALTRLGEDPGQVQKAVHEAQLALGSASLPEAYAGPVVAGRDVVLVDDGRSSPSRLAAAFDFIRRGGPARVVLAVAVAPAERIHEMEEFAGEVLVAVVPAWAEWFRWHGELYESGHLLPDAEVERILLV